MSHSVQSTELLASVQEFSSSNSIKVLEKYEDSSRLILSWVRLLRKSYLTGVADELLFAVASSIREAAALASLGLVRPVLFSLRAQADLMLSWIYFKDHPVEYGTLCRTGEGFVLKKEAISYFRDNYPRFGDRLGILNSVVTRAEVDVYRLLSAHVHSQSPFVISEVNDLKDIVRSRELIKECCSLQKDVSEYLSDIIFSLGIVSEAALPKSVKLDLSERVQTPGQRAVLYK